MGSNENSYHPEIAYGERRDDCKSESAWESWKAELARARKRQQAYNSREWKKRNYYPTTVAGRKFAAKIREVYRIIAATKRKEIKQWEERQHRNSRDYWS